MHAPMAAAIVCKSLGLHPPSHCAASSTRQLINSHDYGRQKRPINASFKAFHHNRLNTGRAFVRALRQGDGGKGNCNKEGGVENANNDGLSRDEIRETMFRGSRDSTQPVKDEREHSSAQKEKPEPCRERLDGLASKLGFHESGSTPRDEDLKTQHHHERDWKKKEKEQEFGKRQSNIKQPNARCRWRSLWQAVRRPENLLAAFLTGLLLYAIALFGWQVMVVAVDVTLFVLKCSFVAMVLLLLYILLDLKR